MAKNVFDSLQRGLEKVLVPIGTKISENKFLGILQKSFVATLPLSLSASIGLIISYFPFIDQVVPADIMNQVIVFFDAVNTATLSLIGLYLAGIIGYNYTKAEGHDGLLGLIVSMCCFLTLTPAGWNEETSAAFFELTWLGSQGILSAILVGFISGFVYNKILDTKFKIVLPSSVPSMVADSFEALLPSIATLGVFAIIRFAVGFTPYGDVHNFLFTVFQTPLMGLGSSLGANIIACIVIQLLWFIGLHGQNIVFAVFNPIYIAATFANLEATTAGEPVPYIITGTFITAFVSMSFFSLVVATAISAKSAQLKAVSKVSIPPAIFNISEPMVFGAPVMLNVMIVIPWVINMVVYLLIPYVMMVTGICPPPTGADIPWTVPPIISGWLVTGSPMGAVAQIINIVVGTFIFLPFVRIYDKQLLDGEQKRAAEEAAAAVVEEA